MKQTIVSTAVALALAGALGTGTALAQSNPPAATPSMPAAASPSTPPMAAPSGQMASPGMSVPARTETGSAAFTKLDMQKRGYLNNEDVSKLQGFNFKNADKNGDGKLDAAEFNAAWTGYGGAAK